MAIRMAKICFRRRVSEGNIHITYHREFTKCLSSHPHDVHQIINLFKMLSRCPGQCGHYLPEAPTLLAALLRDCRILGEAVKLLQVIDCKSPLNGEFLSQLQFCEVIDDQHLWKEMTMTNQVTQSYGDNVFD